jgi:hypothetical protein
MSKLHPGPGIILTSVVRVRRPHRRGDRGCLNHGSRLETLFPTQELGTSIRPHRGGTIGTEGRLLGESFRAQIVYCRRGCGREEHDLDRAAYNRAGVRGANRGR